MAIKTACPSCSQEYTLAESLVGKTVRCKKCAGSFTVEAPAASDGIATSPIRNAMTADEDDEIVEAAVDDGAARRKKKKGKKAAKSGGGNMPLILFGGGAVVLLMLLVCGGGGAVGAYFLWFRDDSSKSSSASSKEKESTKEKESGKEKEKDAGKDRDPNKDREANKDGDNVLMPTPGPGSGMTPENYKKIRAGMTETEMVAILGRPTKTEGPPPGSQGVEKVQTWVNGQDRIVAYYNGGKVGAIQSILPGGGGPGGDPPIGPGTKPVNKNVTRANYDRIKENQSTEIDLVTIFGATIDFDHVTVGPGKVQVVRRYRDGDTVVTITCFEGKVISKKVDGLLK
jgi:hypothetical protein